MQHIILKHDIMLANNITKYNGSQQHNAQILKRINEDC
jgi:hypothetical protein